MLGLDGSLRLRGVLGRVGQAVKVKGMFLHPRKVVAVMKGARGVGATALSSTGATTKISSTWIRDTTS